jgi:hypothetical protein
MGFTETIMNALAQKKLAEAKRTKQEMMEARVKERITGRSSVGRETQLQLAASQKPQLDNDGDDDHRSTRVRTLGNRARTLYMRTANSGAYAAFRMARPIVESEDFELMIIVVIFVNCISLSLFRPTEPPDSTWNSTLDTLELSLNGVFTLEVLLRCMHVGVRGYFRDRWSQFDFTLVLAGYSGFLGGGGGDLRALRAMRALRPLRTITRFESLRSVVVCLVEAVPLLVSVVGLVLFFAFIFAIAGQQLFMVGLGLRYISSGLGYKV